MFLIFFLLNYIPQVVLKDIGLDKSLKAYVSVFYLYNTVPGFKLNYRNVQFWGLTSGRISKTDENGIYIGDYSYTELGAAYELTVNKFFHLSPVLMVKNADTWREVRIGADMKLSYALKDYRIIGFVNQLTTPTNNPEIEVGEFGISLLKALNPFFTSLSLSDGKEFGARLKFSLKYILKPEAFIGTGMQVVNFTDSSLKSYGISGFLGLKKANIWFIYETEYQSPGGLTHRIELGME